MAKIKHVSTLLLGLALATSAAWDNCKFLFGQTWDGPNAAYSSEADYITIWIGNGGGSNTYNTWWEGDMLRRCRSGTLAGKTPVLYSYIIAELAKVKGQLQDCDVAGVGSSRSLCTQGALFIRNNRALVLQKYQEFAQGVAKDWGTTEPVIWLMEPDFYQYTEATSYWGTMAQPLSQAEAGTLMSEMVSRVKAALPNARISLDISPWMGGSNWQSAQTAWLNAMPKSAFSYRHTSGGRTQGNNDRIRSDAGNNATWGGMSQLSGMGIVADDGYGVGGATNGDWTEWMNATNLNARIANGVVALTIPKPGDWTAQIRTLRPQLSRPVTCGSVPPPPPPTAFTLSVTSANGTVAASPSQPSGGYAAGTLVSLTASPNSGYVFNGWTGACTGTGTCSITMDANKTVTANFVPTSTTRYSLTLSGTTNGSISANPAQPTGGYPAGTVVAVAATPNSGYQLSGWTGACSGTGTCSVTMDANKTVGAGFAQQTTTPPTSNKLVNGDFSNGANSWNLGVYGGSASGSVAGGEYVTTIKKAGTQAWHVQFTQGGIALEQGKTYTLSFKARAASNRTVEANIGMSASPYASYMGGFQVALTTTARTFTKTFTMTQPTTASARVEFNSGLSNVKWYLDDVKLVEASGGTFAPRSMDPVGPKVVVSGGDIVFDATGFGESVLELRSLDGSKNMVVWSGLADQTLAVSADKIPRGLWVATLRGQNGSKGQILNLMR